MQYFKKFDFYGKSVSFFYGSSTYHRTIFGGLLSLFTFSLMSAITIYSLYNFLYQKPVINSNVIFFINKKFAELKGMNKQDADSSIKRWAKELKVEEYLQMTAEKLSKGNQQKIQFMTAIIHNPELVILDEPFSGLDPVNTGILKDIIIGLVKDGKYVIMSAHQMPTIEEFCENILILNKGKTVLKGKIKDTKYFNYSYNISQY